MIRAQTPSRTQKARAIMQHLFRSDSEGQLLVKHGDRGKCLEEVAEHFNALLPKLAKLPQNMEMKRAIESSRVAVRQALASKDLARARILTSRLGKLVDKQSLTADDKRDAEILLEQNAPEFLDSSRLVRVVREFSGVCHDFTVSNQDGVELVTATPSPIDLLRIYASHGSRVVVFYENGVLGHSGRLDGDQLTHFLMTTESPAIGVVLETRLDPKKLYGYGKWFTLPDEDDLLDDYLAKFPKA